MKLFGVDEESWQTPMDCSELLKKFNTYKESLKKFLEDHNKSQGK